ncbi:MAG: J domain-containing protein [Chitinophagaceae bacterium]|nr:J domain-containing protein [Chitinophagaceae bacterium]
MFVDYYQILKIEPTASQEDIKKAFRRLAIKYHPDKNPGIDTTKQMQLINEAYLFLKDIEGRTKYDREYQFYTQYEQKQKKNKEEGQYKERQSTEAKAEPEKNIIRKNIRFQDETLKNWMNNAREQSVDLAKETIEDLRAMFKAGANAAIDKVGSMLPGYLGSVAIMLIIVILIKTCK